MGKHACACHNSFDHIINRNTHDIPMRSEISQIGAPGVQTFCFFISIDRLATAERKVSPLETDHHSWSIGIIQLIPCGLISTNPIHAQY